MYIERPEGLPMGVTLEPPRIGRCGFYFQAEDGIRDLTVTGVQTCALPIYYRLSFRYGNFATLTNLKPWDMERIVEYRLSRSEEHTSELQSQSNLVCRLLLEKKKKIASDGASTVHSRSSHLPDRAFLPRPAA